MKPPAVVNEVVTQGDEYLRPRGEQAKDRALDPSEMTGSATAPSEDALPDLTPRHQGDTMTQDTSLPASKDKLKTDVKDSADESQANAGSQGKGVHAPKDGEQIVSRSADPGQSSYGGFSNEDTTKQTQEVESDADAARTPPGKGSAA